MQSSTQVKNKIRNEDKRDTNNEKNNKGLQSQIDNPSFKRNVYYRHPKPILH
jgi:hypothetical protein